MADTTEGLLTRALAADRAAMRSLVTALLPVVEARVLRGLSRRPGKGRDKRQELNDLTQEVFASLFADEARVLRSWDPARGLSLRNFVGLVAERQVAAIFRTGKRSPWTEDPTLHGELDDLGDDAPDLPERALASRELFSALYARLRETLSPQGMHLFQKLVVEERSIADLERETGMSPDALYAWRSRLLKLVRKLGSELESEAGLSEPGRSPQTPVRDGEP